MSSLLSLLLLVVPFRLVCFCYHHFLFCVFLPCCCSAEELKLESSFSDSRTVSEGCAAAVGNLLVDTDDVTFAVFVITYSRIPKFQKIQGVVFQSCM